MSLLYLAGIVVVAILGCRSLWSEWRWIGLACFVPPLVVLLMLGALAVSGASVFEQWWKGNLSTGAAAIRGLLPISLLLLAMAAALALTWSWFSQAMRIASLLLLVPLLAQLLVFIAYVIGARKRHTF